MFKLKFMFIAKLVRNFRKSVIYVFRNEIQLLQEFNSKKSFFIE
jgi:hypothetical protein